MPSFGSRKATPVSVRVTGVGLAVQLCPWSSDRSAKPRSPTVTSRSPAFSMSSRMIRSGLIATTGAGRSPSAGAVHGTSVAQSSNPTARFLTMECPPRGGPGR